MDDFGFTTKMMYGINAVHVPMWMVVQNHGEHGVMFAGASRSPDLMYKSNQIHALILGEVIVRPHFVVTNNNFAGHGLQGFWTSNPSAREWLDGGQVAVWTQRGEDAFKRWK